MKQLTLPIVLESDEINRDKAIQNLISFYISQYKEEKFEIPIKRYFRKEVLKGFKERGYFLNRR